LQALKLKNERLIFFEPKGGPSTGKNPKKFSCEIPAVLAFPRLENDGGMQIIQLCHIFEAKNQKNLARIFS
jgi:hypothetical protein